MRLERRSFLRRDGALATLDEASDEGGVVEGQDPAAGQLNPQAGGSVLEGDRICHPLCPPLDF